MTISWKLMYQSFFIFCVLQYSIMHTKVIRQSIRDYTIDENTKLHSQRLKIIKTSGYFETVITPQVTSSKTVKTFSTGLSFP